MATQPDKLALKDSSGSELARTETFSTIQFTPEQFERMYLGPPNKVHGDLRRTFGNPTPVGLGGFLLAFTPLVCQLMGWDGTLTAEGVPTVGTFMFLGGLPAILASIGEFILGNSFPSCFFGVYGGFFLTYGWTVSPWTQAATTFASPSTYTKGMNDVEAAAAAFKAGGESPAFTASIGFLGVFVALYTFMLTIAALRTNLIFVLAFFTLGLAVVFYSVSRFEAAAGRMDLYMTYQQASGGTGFATAMLGWYLLFAEILSTVDFPLQLPVFDLSARIPGASDLERNKRHTERRAEGDS